MLRVRDKIARERESSPTRGKTSPTHFWELIKRASPRETETVLFGTKDNCRVDSCNSDRDYTADSLCEQSVQKTA